MAARKTTRRKSARKATRKSGKARKTSQRALLKTIDRELKDLSKQLEARLRPLRTEMAKAEKRAGSGAARLLGQAKARLGKVKITGHGDWEKFLRRSRADLTKALGQLERSVRKASKPKRRKAAGRKKTVRRKATRKKAARR